MAYTNQFLATTENYTNNFQTHQMTNSGHLVASDISRSSQVCLFLVIHMKLNVFYLSPPYTKRKCLLADHPSRGFSNLKRISPP